MLDVCSILMKRSLKLTFSGNVERLESASNSFFVALSMYGGGSFVAMPSAQPAAAAFAFLGFLKQEVNT